MVYAENLPPGWAEVPFEDLLKEGPTNGYSPKSGSDATGTASLRLSATTSGQMILAPETTKRLYQVVPADSKYWLEFGDLLVQRANSLKYLGAAAIYEGQPNAYVYPDLMMRIRFHDPHTCKYVWRFLNSGRAREFFKDNATGTAGNMPKINGRLLKNLPVPVAPLDEQRRIVAKLEALQQRTRRARAALDAIPPLLEKFRQSVLAAAFRGDLTVDWRAQNTDVAPASVLLERIREESRRRWEEAELAKMRAKGKVPSDDRWKGRYRQPLSIDCSNLGRLPDGWAWASLDELLDRIEAGKSPKAQSRPAEEGEYGVLKVSAVSWGQFKPQENKALLPATKPIQSAIVRAGDLLISRANTVDLVGAVVLVQQDFPNLVLSDKTLRLVYDASVVRGNFLLYALRISAVRKIFESRATGTSDSMRNLSQAKIRSAPIPVPPLAEQDALVSKLEEMTATRLGVAGILNLTGEELGHLDQALLSRAFRGELVPQDANDEPAAVLLERIRAARSEKPSRRRQIGTRKLVPRPVDLPLESRDEPQSTPNPATGEVCAVLRRAHDYTAADWRHALLECLGDDPAEREDAIEAAAIWAAENMGLEFQRLRRDGVILRGLEAALENAIVEGEVVRLGSSGVQKT